MTDHQFIDAVPIADAGAVTRDGYRPYSVRAGRTGIQVYHGAEFGIADRDIVRVYRPEAEVFAPDSMRSLAHRPVTLDHPTEPVTAETWKSAAVGAVGDEITRDGEFLRVPMLLMDAEAIKAVDAGKRELSLGYTANLTMQDGESPEGEPYDAVMTSLRHNHLAIVAKGRAGPDVRIGDSWGAAPILAADKAVPAVTATTTEDRSMGTRTIVVDGLPVEITDAGAAAVEKLQGEKQAALDTAAQVKAAADTAIEAAKLANRETMDAKDAEIAAKDAEIADLKRKVLSDADIDQRVAARASLISKASKIATDADFNGKSDRDIKTMAVAAARGAEFAKDKSDAYIDAAFDLIEAPKGTGDSVRDALINREPVSAVATDAYTEMKSSLENAWKGKTGEAA